MTSYELSRNWFDWCFENPEKISPTHTAMYFFIIEHCNRLGWKEKFGLPMEMTKDAIGIKNYRTFTKVFNDLIEWGFIILIQKSKNQYSSNVIAIAENTIAPTKALDKAIQKHTQKQVHGIVGIDKPNNKEEPLNNETELLFPLPVSPIEEKFKALQKIIIDEFPFVSKMASQLTIDQYLFLTKKYKYEEVMDIFRKMNNWKPLLKQNTSVHDTAIDWMGRDKLKKLA